MPNILYEDKDVIITDKEVIIKCYFFPFGNSKTIPYSDINQIDLYKLLSTLDRVGYEELKSDNDSLFAEIDSIMNDLGDAMKFSKANKLLKDL